MRFSTTIEFREPSRSSAFLSMLACLLLITGCGGKEAVAPESVTNTAFDDFREAIAEVVEDPTRQAQILALVDDYQSDFSHLLASVETQRTELRRLNANFDASREQFQDYFDKYNAQIRAARQAAMKSRTAFVQSTTTEEWDALNKADTKTMEQLVNSIQGI